MTISRQATLPFVGTSLAEAREQVMAGRWGDGVVCPCCDQLARVYRRSLNGAQVRWLLMLVERSIQLSRAFRWHHDRPEAYGWVSKEEWLPPIPEGGDYAKLTLWRLAEAMTKESAGYLSTCGRSGVWRPTPLGIDFAYGRAAVTAAVLVYDGELVGLDPEAPLVYARDVAGKTFDYDELLATLPRMEQNGG